MGSYVNKLEYVFRCILRIRSCGLTSYDLLIDGDPSGVCWIGVMLSDNFIDPLILKSGNLAAPGRIRPSPESSYFRGYGQHLRGRRRDSAKVPKWARADTAEHSSVARDTLLCCDCRQGSGETVSREGTDARNAQGEMKYRRTTRYEGMRWREHWKAYEANVNMGRA